MLSKLAIVLTFLVCYLTLSSSATPTQEDVVEFRRELGACCEEDQCADLLRRFDVKDQAPYHLTLQILEDIGELIQAMGPTRSIQIHPTELEIDFYDGEEKWSFLSTPWESYCSSSFGHQINKIVRQALDPYKEPVCQWEGCWGDCTGFESDHENGWCNECTQTIDRCSCD